METLKFLFKSLFSNAEVATNGKKQKWWLTFVILIASILLAVAPNIVTGIKANGGSYVTNYTNQQVNDGLTTFSSEYLHGKDAKLNLTINNGELIVGENSFDKLENRKVVKVGDKDVAYIDINVGGKTIMVVSYVESSSSYDALELAIINDKKVETKDEEGNITKVTAPVVNSLFFSKKDFKLNIAALTSTAEFKKDASGNYVFDGTVQHYSQFKGVYTGISTAYSDLSNIYADSISKTEDNWVAFFNEAYKPLKFSSLVYSTVLYLALDVMALVVMIFTTFIMSRFKNSLCEKLSVATAFKFVVFLALTPGLISFLIHFIMPGMQSIAFFTCLAIRCIFFNTKFTRGALTGEQPKK